MAAKSVYTTVSTTLRVAKLFSFLPPHGRTIAPRETVRYEGLLDNMISLRHAKAFEAAVTKGEIVVTRTMPA